MYDVGGVPNAHAQTHEGRGRLDLSSENSDMRCINDISCSNR